MSKSYLYIFKLCYILIHLLAFNNIFQPFENTLRNDKKLALLILAEDEWGKVQEMLVFLKVRK